MSDTPRNFCNLSCILQSIKSPSACSPVAEERSVHFARSTPSYIPVKRSDGVSGNIVMPPLKQLDFHHSVFGGAVTRKRNRYGIRVRNTEVRYGIVCNGTVSCDSKGRINARKLNNDSSLAVAAAKKLFYEVHRKSVALTTTTATNAITVVNALSTTLRWIADSGASMDFIGKNTLSAMDKSRLIKAKDGDGTVTIERQLRTQ